jgi:hypothetical protein
VEEKIMNSRNQDLNVYAPCGLHVGNLYQQNTHTFFALMLSYKHLLDYHGLPCHPITTTRTHNQAAVLIGYLMMTQSRFPLALGTYKQVHLFIRYNQERKLILSMIKTPNEGQYIEDPQVTEKENHDSLTQNLQIIKEDFHYEVTRLLPPELLPQQSLVTFPAVCPLIGKLTWRKRTPALVVNTFAWQPIRLDPHCPTSILSVFAYILSIARNPDPIDEKADNVISPPGMLLSTQIDANSAFYKEFSSMQVDLTYNREFGCKKTRVFPRVPDTFPDPWSYTEDEHYIVGPKSAYFSAFISLFYSMDPFEDMIVAWHQAAEYSQTKEQDLELYTTLFDSLNKRARDLLYTAPHTKETETFFNMILTFLDPKNASKRKNPTRYFANKANSVHYLELFRQAITKEPDYYVPELIAPMRALINEVEALLESLSDAEIPMLFSLLATALTCCHKELNPAILSIALRDYTESSQSHHRTSPSTSNVLLFQFLSQHLPREHQDTFTRDPSYAMLCTENIFKEVLGNFEALPSQAPSPTEGLEEFCSAPPKPTCHKAKSEHRPVLLPRP